MIDSLDDKAHDECGVFGIYAPGRDVARLAFFALYALQHRGQESAGIATSDGRSAYTHKAMGLVAQVFDEDRLKPLQGHLAIGHTRYSTTGSSHVRNAQPYVIETIYGPLGVSHNGNITNALQLRQRLLERGVGLTSTTDSEVMTQMLAAPPDVWGITASGNGPAALDEWQLRIKGLMNVAEGAYSLAILTRDAVYAARDPHGLRPMCIGQIDGGYVVASETCALHTIGATFLRDVNPGEIVRIDARGIDSAQGRNDALPRALCSFEFVYFARPDSTLDGRSVHHVRQLMGRQLARESPVNADIVVPVPDSSNPAAIGYSLESGIPYIEGLIKNRYIGRTFIQPDNALRKMGVQLKFNPLKENLDGMRVILVDDSIVRGNTSGPIVKLLRDAGASEVHVRVSSPPVRHPCFMGVDMATYRELIAHNMDVDHIRAHIGADSLAYLSLEGMLAAQRGAFLRDGGEQAASPDGGFCTACFSGRYPIRIPAWLFEDERDKRIFEAHWG